MGSSAFQLDRADLLHILKVAAYGCASVMIAALTMALAHAQFSSQYVWLVPIVNTVLVAAKRFVDDHSVE